MHTKVDIFRSNFKYSPSRCAFLYRYIRNDPVLPDGYGPQHLLWTLYFILTYAPERCLCCILNADRKTIRKYTWPTITALARLARQYVSESGRTRPFLLCSLSHTYDHIDPKIRWENRLIDDKGRAAKVTVDGTDFPTMEYRPFNRGRMSHKFNGPGLRYEVALRISNCHIVHINGPFICGQWTDIGIARSWLHARLRPHEYYLADKGYRFGPGPAMRFAPYPLVRLSEILLRRR
jgi:hypothetical protein